VGCVSALEFARRGARVLLLEANPRASQRLAGEWLHPPALEQLRRLGVDLEADRDHGEGRGFAIFPDDGSEPVVLRYREGSRGICCEHDRLVSRLRERVEIEAGIQYVPFARAVEIDEPWVTYEQRESGRHTVRAKLLIGAGGRQSVAHQQLGLTPQNATFSRMAGLILEDSALPFEGFGHVFLGGPGPALAYRVDASRIRLCLDVPLARGLRTDAPADLWDAFHTVLPSTLREGFRHGLRSGAVAWAANQLRPRVNYGRDGLVLVGDAVGCYHPLTALGMTLGFEDAYALAGSGDFDSYRSGRLLKNRVPEILSVALYEVFADTSPEINFMRSAIYDLWRREPEEQQRTMGFLAGEDTSLTNLARASLKTLRYASFSLMREGMATGRWRHLGQTSARLATRVGGILIGTLGPGSSNGGGAAPHTAEQRYGDALRVSRPQPKSAARFAEGAEAASPDSSDGSTGHALELGMFDLQSRQADDGSWEGEVVWCPMLAAQYVLTCHVTQTSIEPARRTRILQHFADTRLECGSWGLHRLSQPYLFVTTLVYVASRLLGVDEGDPRLAPARRFIRDEGGAIGIPSWGKFWLAMLGLYPWKGVNPVLPELFSLPSWLPVHPSRFYCHTRMIYLAMAAIYGRRVSVPCTPIVEALRVELYPDGYDNLSPTAARSTLREAEIHTPPSRSLRILFSMLRLVDRAQSTKRRNKVLRRMSEHIRYELRATDHTSISPVSGLLNMIALWLEDPQNEDLLVARQRFERWVWEDDRQGFRVAGARSATWDTAFAVQALAAGGSNPDAADSLRKAGEFLQTQQIGRTPRRAAEFHRIDPIGGYCFGNAWHGWPVSDCTAEAIVARLAIPEHELSPKQIDRAIRFILRCQNPDGGFGSYEPRRTGLPLEWLNPAEMFGDSMSEASLVECSASCIAALTAVRERHPELLRGDIDRSISRAGEWLRRQQLPDGSWPGSWGVHFIYGTMFGIRGLLAAGAPSSDAVVRRACSWLRQHQRHDGGWGEHHSSCTSGSYVDHERSQVIQTSWAMIALLEAQEPNWHCLDRAGRFLAESQLADGQWPGQDPAGVFFHTALLDYSLYRSYFPLRALRLYEDRRRRRVELNAVDSPTAAARDRVGALS